MIAPILIDEFGDFFLPLVGLASTLNSPSQYQGNIRAFLQFAITGALADTALNSRSLPMIFRRNLEDIVVFGVAVAAGEGEFSALTNGWEIGDGVIVGSGLGEEWLYMGARHLKNWYCICKKSHYIQYLDCWKKRQPFYGEPTP